MKLKPSVFPYQYVHDRVRMTSLGLDAEDLFAAVVMHALIPTYSMGGHYNPASVAEIAVAYARALARKLKEPETCE